MVSGPLRLFDFLMGRYWCATDWGEQNTIYNGAKCSEAERRVNANPTSSGEVGSCLNGTPLEFNDLGPVMVPEW